MHKSKTFGANAALALLGLFTPAGAWAAGPSIQITVPFEIKGIPSSVTEIDIVCEVVKSGTLNPKSVPLTDATLFGTGLYSKLVFSFRRTIKIDPATGNAIDKSPLVFSVSDARGSNGKEIPAIDVKQFGCIFVKKGGSSNADVWLYRYQPPLTQSSFTTYAVSAAGKF